MQCARFPKPLHRDDPAALCLDSEYQTRSNCLAIDHDGACATHAMRAAKVRAGQAAMLAQCIRQCLTRLQGQPMPLPIHLEFDIDLWVHRTLRPKARRTTARKSLRRNTGLSRL